LLFVPVTQRRFVDGAARRGVDAARETKMARVDS
jgi:hypothetical protein